MTALSVPAAQLSAVDEERFGIRTARASELTVDGLPAVLDFCREQAVVLLIARCRADDQPAVHALEREGFLLMDTLIYYQRDLGLPLPAVADDVVHPLRSGEEEQVREAAAATFRGYKGHYHADVRLDRARCDEVYADWAYQACLTRDPARQVLLARIQQAIAGLAVLRRDENGEGEGQLLGIVPWAQRRGIYRSLLIRAMEWCAAGGAHTMRISTQITNIPVQRAWVRVGFEPSQAFYTFHRWFD